MGDNDILIYKQNLEDSENEIARLDAIIENLKEENQKLVSDFREIRRLYTETSEENIRLRHSEHKEKMIGEAIENELKRIIRQGYF